MKALAVDEIVTEKWLKERLEAHHQKQNNHFPQEIFSVTWNGPTEESGPKRPTFMVPTLFLKSFLPGITV